MPAARSHDAIIIGAGHNGLVAACYLAQAGKSVLVLEKNTSTGGASVSQRPFPDFDARLSRYAYLVSLFPPRIMRELSLDVPLLRRSVASFTPYGNGEGLLISNQNPDVTRHGIEKLHPADWSGYQTLLEKQTTFAELVWDSMLEPLRPRSEWVRHFEQHGHAELWSEFVDAPIGELIEKHLTSDLLRGILLTDGKIGANTHAHDPSLLQNRTFLYHIIGNKTGEWLVPQGGMGNLTDQLAARAKKLGVEILTEAEVIDATASDDQATVRFRDQGREFEHHADHVLWNACPPDLREPNPKGNDEGTAFKINMLLKQLPRLKDRNTTPEQAFAGTFHIDESYSQMEATHHAAASGTLPDTLAGEIYCHTLTDPSILSTDLRQQGYHTLTYFGLDLPYALFEHEPEQMKAAVVERFLHGINAHLETPLESCLAIANDGTPCLEAKSAVDLEHELGLPRGNIFHKSLSWFFTEDGDPRTGKWGVETHHPRILICGSAAMRGGAVSGIPGRNAAMAVLRSARA